MPQMSPMWWSTLFTMFVLSFMMVMMLLYYFVQYKSNMSYKNKKLMKINWKW